MLHCNGKGGHATQRLKNSGNGCLVHPDTRSLWWIRPDPDLRSSWPKPTDSHPDVIDVISDGNDDDDSADESNKCEPIKTASPCCSHRDSSVPCVNSFPPQPIFRPICPTPSQQVRPPQLVRQSFPPLTRQDCVDVQISYPRVVQHHNSTKQNFDGERVLVSYPTFDCPNSFRPFNQATVPYHALSPHPQCQMQTSNGVCRRLDSLTSSSSSCCRRPDSSCSCQHRYRFKTVDHNQIDPVYDRVLSWLVVKQKIIKRLFQIGPTFFTQFESLLCSNLTFTMTEIRFSNMIDFLSAHWLVPSQNLGKC